VAKLLSFFLIGLKRKEERRKRKEERAKSKEERE